MSECQWTPWECLEITNKNDKSNAKSVLKKIRLSCGIQDQGWGNVKGAVDMKLCRGEKLNESPKSEWDQDASGTFNDTVKRQIILEATHDYQYLIKEFDQDSDFVKLYKTGILSNYGTK